MNDRDFDLLEQLDETDLYSATEGLSEVTTIFDFWDSMARPKQRPQRNSSPSTVEVAEIASQPKEATPGGPGFDPRVTDFTLNAQDLEEMWSWDDKGAVFKQLSMIKPGSTLNINVNTDDMRVSFREFLEILGLCNIIRSMKFRIVVHVAMYITPRSLIWINLADQLVFGKYVSVSLHSLFMLNDDVPPKFKPCVDEMQEMLTRVIIERNILTEEEVSKLRTEPQAGFEVKMLFQD